MNLGKFWFSGLICGLQFAFAEGFLVSMRFVMAAVAAAFFSIAPTSSAAESARVTPQHVARNEILEAPKPEYPDAAKRRDQRGTGVYLLRTKIATGVVTEVIIGQSTGNALLDDAAVKALRQWRFKPGVLVHRDIHKPRLKRPIAKDECLVLVPVTF